MDIFIDIETIPTQDESIQKHILDNVTADGRLKDPEKIKADIAKKSDEAVDKTGLSGLFGTVLCVGLAVDDSPVKTLYNTTGEDNLLADVRALICPPVPMIDEPYCSSTLIGHNSVGFDVPFLSQRMMINGMKPLFPNGVKPWDMNVEDTMLLFACGSKNYYSLDDLCLAFGVKSPKGDMDGSKVYEYYQAGRHSEIQDYCRDDVQATREIYRRMVK
jgi:hypothetical protein